MGARRCLGGTWKADEVPQFYAVEPSEDFSFCILGFSSS